MITLHEVTVHKYKCIESDQAFEVDKDVTVLVGMNESGKTSILEALAKTNYFQDDKDFEFNMTHDFPRKEKKKVEKAGEIAKAVTCKYIVSDELSKIICSDVGDGVFVQKEITRCTNYNNGNTWIGIRADIKKFVENKTKELKISSKTLNDKLAKAKSIEDLNEIKKDYVEDGLLEGLSKLDAYFDKKMGNFDNPVEEYIVRTYLKPNLPKFLYYDEYYTLPSRISIEELMKADLDSDDMKTAKALFELAEINMDELVSASDFEDFKAELEATQATITEELFTYWSTNQNLDIQFDIDKVEATDPQNNTRIVEHVLVVRVRNNRTKVSLPLKNRSKGFNWFFSFLVWFKKIQEDVDSKYILLLDEPGLNLHASAQADLLDFIEHLAGAYQIIYTTHSPFMVDPKDLHRVRTVLETDKGSLVSDSIQEKDPNTLFPLQAALGYDIAQNLFISNNNLLVEGVSDLIYLQTISGLLQESGKTYLREDITIVPVGGLDKVSTFVSLLRGSKLDIVCLLDSSIDQSSRSKIDNLIRGKIIHSKKILFYDEFVDEYNESDVEDLFTKAEYLQLFNAAHTEHQDISEGDLDEGVERIIVQLNKHLGVARFNHYRPANALTRMGVDGSTFSNETLKRFEAVFEKVNSLF